MFHGRRNARVINLQKRLLTDWIVLQYLPTSLDTIQSRNVGYVTVRGVLSTEPGMGTGAS